MSKISSARWKVARKFLSKLEWQSVYPQSTAGHTYLHWGLKGPDKIPGTFSVNVEACIGIPYKDMNSIFAKQAIAMVFVIGKELGVPLRYTFGYPGEKWTRISPKRLSKSWGITTDEFEMYGHVALATLTTMFLPRVSLDQACPPLTLKEAVEAVR